MKRFEDVKNEIIIFIIMGLFLIYIVLRAGAVI
jgi:hypothetical protein